jgi:subfamily B ATP-binding cassette protein MsbA
MVLKGITLNIPKGKMVALVGASGAGKSTIADLLPRFYDPTQGKILIDGLDLRNYDIRSLRQKMGVVSQDTFLFNNTVFYNIAYGLENITEAEVIEAAKRANAYEFILNLPKGFETELGDRGVLLSGGQKQRMAIARALLRDPEILILDEATSALDTVSEQLVQEAINELSQSKTSLVIAHRLSTVHRADQIAVLDQGKIVELGTHEQLMEKAGYYQRLYLMQFKHQSQEASFSP